MTKECFTSKSSPAPHTGKQFFWDVLCPGLHRTLGTGLGEWCLHGKKPRHIQGQWHRQPPCEQRRRRGRASVLAVAFSKSLSCTPMVQEAALPLAFWVPSSHSFWSLHFCQMLEQCNSVFSSVSRSVVSNSLRPHDPQDARPPCPSSTAGVHPNPCPLSHWCHPTISSSVIPFSSCPQPFPASGSFSVLGFC